MNSKLKDKITIGLAYFNRYGYFAIMILILLGLSLAHVPTNIWQYTLCGMLSLYGVYSLLGLRFKLKHIYCAMQNANGEKMTPNNFRGFTKKMEKDIKILGWIFTTAGIVGFIVFFTGI